MNKTELIEQTTMFRTDNSTVAENRAAVNAFLHCLAAVLEKGEDVTIQDFGTFRVRDTPARTGRNPHTGEPVAIPAGKKVSFKPAKALKEKVNG